MTHIEGEFAEDTETVPADERNTEPAEVESAEEYGYVEPSTDVPPPPDTEDQNPGANDGGAR